MPFGIGPGELVLILLIALVVIGPSRLPDVGAALGKSIKEFRKASSDITEATTVDVTPQAAPAAPATTAVAAPVAPAPAPNTLAEATTPNTLAPTAAAATVAAPVADSQAADDAAAPPA